MRRAPAHTAADAAHIAAKGGIGSGRARGDRTWPASLRLATSAHLRIFSLEALTRILFSRRDAVLFRRGPPSAYQFRPHRQHRTAHLSIGWARGLEHHGVAWISWAASRRSGRKNSTYRGRALFLNENGVISAAASWCGMERGINRQMTSSAANISVSLANNGSGENNSGNAGSAHPATSNNGGRSGGAASFAKQGRRRWRFLSALSSRA